MLRRCSSARSGVWLTLLLVLAVPVSVSGCCSKPQVVRVPADLPLFLAPPDRTAALVERSSQWADTEDGIVLVPQNDLELILLDRAQWRAYAKALEEAGRVH